MPYREYPRIPEHVRAQEPDQALRRFDVSGRKGKDGRHGQPGDDGVSKGAQGQRGDDAGPAEPGQPAGTINLALATADTDGMARLEGTMVRPDGHIAALDDVLTFGERGFIELCAVGGDGGQGGNGGDGGDGARGRRGRDATRYSSGSDGGPGGDGGDGGNATSGGSGGQGGDITVIVDETDTQLLMLVEHAIHGGTGGQPGMNGAGGSGGPGGSGGSSYSWTETESYTDSQGNSQTRTTHHSKPGGWSGPAGSPGRAGTARVRRGAEGDPGSFAIEVKSTKGVATYASRYDLCLVSFAHDTADQDCVYEPQETVRVFDIEVENTGGMPTPAHRDIELTLVRRGWVAPVDERLILPRALAPGERCTLDGALHFVIGDWKPQRPDDPLELEEVMGHRARLPSVYRDFAGYEHEGSREMGQFVIRFPVRAEPIVSLYSLAPGQSARMRWSVINQSSAALGAASECGRVVRVRLSLHDSELGDEHLCCRDEEGASLSLAEGFCRDIDLLEPGGRADFEITLGVTEGAPHYHSVQVWLSLELGYLDKPAQARPIQYREFSTRVSRPYQADEGADLLLVVNHKTTREALGAWQELARSMGFRLNTWDLSFQRSLDLRAPLGGRGSLIEQFRGRIIAVCDNAIDAGEGQTAHPHWFLAKDDLFAAVGAGVSVALLGRGVADLHAHLIPTHHDDDAERPGTGTSPAELLEALARSREARQASQAREQGTLDSGGALERVHQSVDVRTRLRLWGQPGTMELTARAHWLARRLRDQHPDRRYIVIHDYRPEVVGRFLWMKRWRLGELLVRGTIHTAAGTLVHERMADHEVHDPQRILAPSTIMTVLLTRSLDEKLARLDALLFAAGEPRAELIALVVDAICVDLASEQHAVMITGWRSGLSARELGRSLPLLGRVAAFRFSAGGALPLDSPCGEALIRMMARLFFLFETQARWWEWPLYPWRRGPRLRRTSKRMLGELLEHARDDVFDVSGQGRAMDRARRKEVRRRIRAEVKNLRHEHRNQRRMDPLVGPPGEYSRALLRAPLEREGVTTDVELLTELDSRVLSREEYDQLCAADQAALERRARLMRDQAHARADLLVAD
jgi:hypothetical protein